VLLAKVAGFHPGIIYGFVASTIVLTPLALSRGQEARIILVPAFAMLGISVVAWLALIPLDSVAGSEPGFLMATLQSVLGILFLGGLEGVLFALLPIRFMDGAKVMAWSRLGWAAAFGTVVFLWWQLLLNRDAAYVEALTQSNVQAAMGTLLFFALTTGTVWVFFRVRDQWRAEEVEA
jgi:hypothetical protein